VAEILVTFSDIVGGEGGEQFIARACGTQADDGMWHGWIEFTPVDGGVVHRSGRETTQPNRQDLVYWATGLTPIYLEGALERARFPRAASAAEEETAPVYDGPAPAAPGTPKGRTSVLNPFSVYRRGEAMLRRQLGAISGWHLINVIRDYGLSEQTDTELGRLTDQELLELVVAAVKIRRDEATVQ
jgi:hypothetical protein